MLVKRILAITLSGALLIGTAPAQSINQTDQSTQSPTPVVKQTPEQLQQLVAPIAIYPDELVAEVLAAATYPAEVVEADRWLREYKELQGKQLADEVDKQPWDPSIKALTEFPSVLANMDKNLSWTSSLGQAYMNQQQDVMNAVQVMRQRAEQAGNLKSNSQVQVTTQGSTIVIEPVNQDVIYVPTYDPWVVYGAPLAVWPGWFWYPGLYVAQPGISFGLGFGVGFFGGYGWGWHNWGFDWAHQAVIYNHTAYISRSTTIINRNNFYGARSGAPQGFASHENMSAQHWSPPTSDPVHTQPSTHSDSGSGFNHGGVTHGFSAKGHSSGAFHGGDGFHDGGFHRGGRK